MKKTRFLCSAQKTMISCALFTTTYYKVQISAVSEPWRNHVFLCTAQKSLISHAQYSNFFYFTGEVGCELLCAINKSFQQESLVGKCCTMWSFKKSHVNCLHTNKRYQLHSALQNRRLHGITFFLHCTKIIDFTCTVLYFFLFYRRTGVRAPVCYKQIIPTRESGW